MQYGCNEENTDCGAGSGGNANSAWGLQRTISCKHGHLASRPQLAHWQPAQVSALVAQPAVKSDNLPMDNRGLSVAHFPSNVIYDSRSL